MSAMDTPERQQVIERPGAAEYGSFYQGYVESIDDDDVIDVMRQQLVTLNRLSTAVDPALERHRYAPGKWSVREVVGHLIDAERVFGYRAFCISRGDETPLPGFDEGHYVARAGSDERPLESLIDELAAVRQANLHVFLNLPPGSGETIGNANGSSVSVRALAFITAGHFQHHLRVLEQKYGVAI